jgi:septum formation protein
MNIILASQSPRRKELLGLMNIPFTVRVADIDETLDSALSVAEAVAQLSRRKAAAIPRQPEDIVIAADTVVVRDGVVLGKPKDEKDAFRMLSMLSGRKHQVLTGVTVLRGEKAVSHTESTDIFFRPLEEAEIRSYIATGDPMDKAGAYGIQNGAALFVEKINGDYFNVVGLPVCRLGCILKEFMEETK